MAAQTLSTRIPDHDFNNTWGIVLSATEVQKRPIADRFMQEYWRDPVTAERRYGSILSQYTDKFE
jgi:hypothetical protein